MSDFPTNPDDQPQPTSTGTGQADTRTPSPIPPRKSDYAHLHRRAPHFLPIAMLGALAVGLTVALVSGLSFEFVSVLHVENADTAEADPSTKSYDTLKQSLLEFVATDQISRTVSASLNQTWSCYQGNEGSLGLRLRTSNPISGPSRVERGADEFRRWNTAAVTSQRETPSELEQYLTSRIDQWNDDLAELRRTLEQTQSNLPGHDQSADRDQILEQWRAHSRDYSLALAQTRGYASQVEELHETNISGATLVTDEQRQRAYKANVALQQDLAELSVNLMEIKAHLLVVWQATSGPLERLRASAEEYAETISRNSGENLSGSTKGATRLVRDAQNHSSHVTQFTTAWSIGFTAVRSGDVDPHSSSLLVAFENQQQALDDYLVAAGEQLRDIRSGVDNLQSDPTVTPKHHVALSNIVRSHQRLETHHRRFKFSTSGMEVPNNFRLDSALRIARGLRRRTRARMQIVETKLQDDAIKNAQDQLTHDLIEAEKSAKHARVNADRLSEELMELQNELLVIQAQQESYLRTSATRRGLSAQIETIERAIKKAQGQRQQAVVNRQTSGDGSDITIGSVMVNGWSLSYQRAFTGGWVAALAALITLVICQRYASRRSIR